MPPQLIFFSATHTLSVVLAALMQVLNLVQDQVMQYTREQCAVLLQGKKKKGPTQPHNILANQN